MKNRKSSDGFWGWGTIPFLKGAICPDAKPVELLGREGLERLPEQGGGGSVCSVSHLCPF